MLKSDILKKLELKHKSLSESDIEQIFNIFVKKITSALKDNRNVELRGFGTFKKKSTKLNKLEIQKRMKSYIKKKISNCTLKRVKHYIIN